MDPLGRLAQSALAGPVRAAPLSPGKVAFVWAMVVGPAMARATSVRLEGTELLVDAASAQWRREVTRAVPLILPRLQTLLGSDRITRIKARHA
jgi:hypothetical protein